MARQQNFHCRRRHRCPEPRPGLARQALARAGQVRVPNLSCRAPSAARKRALLQRRQALPVASRPRAAGPPHEAAASSRKAAAEGRQNPARDVTRVKCETAMLRLALRMSRITTSLGLHEIANDTRLPIEGEAADEDFGCNRCVASADQRRGAHTRILGHRRARLGLDARFSYAGWLRLPTIADLSWPALRRAETGRNRQAHRAYSARCDSCCHRGTNRPLRAALLPAARPAIHHKLHDPLPRVYRRARTAPRGMELRGAAPFSRPRGCHHGLDAVAGGGVDRTRLSTLEDVEPWRRQ